MNVLTTPGANFIFKVDSLGIRSADASAASATLSAEIAVNSANAAQESELAAADAAEMAINALESQPVLGTYQVVMKLKGVDIKGELVNEVAPLGAELLDATGWTSVGWSGDFNTGFIHTAGQVTPLIKTLPATGQKIYLVELTVSTPTKSTDFTISIGGSVPFIMYEGDSTLHTYSRGIKSISDGNLVITPGATFDGTITGISVKEVTGTIAPTVMLKDAAGVNTLEIRPTNASLENVFIGIGTGQFNVTGHENVGIGINVLKNSVSGFWNTGIGKDSLRDNTSGSRNCAVGFLALAENISGHRNVAIGTFALTRNTHGANNIALGADSLWYNTIGNFNIGVCVGALAENVNGNDNIALGQGSLSGNVSGNGNIGIGQTTMSRNVVGNDNIAMGRVALNYNTASNNMALGYFAGYHNTTGTLNVILGYNALYQNHAGSSNIAIGDGAGFGAANCDINNNILIGHNAGNSLNTGGDYNTCIGSSSGASITTGNHNINLGFNTSTPTPTDNYKLNIGNLIYGDLTAGHTGIGMVPNTDSDAVYGAINTALKLQIGKSNRMGAVDLTIGTNINGTMVGAIGFVNQNNLNTSGGTRKPVAYMSGSIVTTDANVSGNSGGILQFFTKAIGGGNNEVMRITDTWRIGILVTAPTAKLHLAGGTSAANSAPLKLNSGTINATPEAGAIEFDGTNLYFTRNDGTRKTLAVI